MNYEKVVEKIEKMHDRLGRRPTVQEVCKATQVEYNTLMQMFHRRGYDTRGKLLLNARPNTQVMGKHLLKADVDTFTYILAGYIAQREDWRRVFKTLENEVRRMADD